MSREHTAILILFIINIMIIIAYIIPHIIEKDDKGRGYIIKAVIMFICPIVAPLFFFLSHIFYLIFYKSEVDLADVVFSKEKVQTHIHADEEQDLNVVPLEEAIAVSDTGSLRLLVMNVVRGDIRKSLSSIALALNSEDSETSHYAASVLQDELNEFRMNVQKIYIEIKRAGKDQAEYAAMLIEYMNQVLEQNVFTDMEQESFVKTMEEVADILYEKDKEKMTNVLYEHVCLRLLEIKKFELCEKWCKRAKAEYPNTLSSFTCMLKLYFTSNQNEKFFSVLEELKKSNIVIDNETLELIRTFG